MKKPEWVLVLLFVAALWSIAFVIQVGQHRAREGATTTTLPSSTLLGAFLPGWTTAPTPLAYQQTYVSACSDAYVLPHRLSQMHGNTPIINLPIPGTIEDILVGDTDQCWLNILDQVPVGSIVVPLAEANGPWTSYHASPSQFREAWDRIRGLASKPLVWCWAPDLGVPWEEYEPDDYDLSCPSIYPWAVTEGTPEEIVNAASAMRPPVLIQQTGTTSDHAQWLIEVLRLAETRGFLGVVYFNHEKYAFDWSTL